MFDMSALFFMLEPCNLKAHHFFLTLQISESFGDRFLHLDHLILQLRILLNKNKNTNVTSSLPVRVPTNLAQTHLHFLHARKASGQLLFVDAQHRRLPRHLRQTLLHFRFRLLQRVKQVLRSIKTECLQTFHT